MASAVVADERRKAVAFQDPLFVYTLFNTIAWAWLWLIVRLYVGYSWLTSGLGKLSNPAWVQTGAALTGFWERAAAIPDAPARPLIAFDWYRTFIQFLLDGGHYTWFAKLVTAGEILKSCSIHGKISSDFERSNSMTLQHLLPSRHAARPLAGFMILTLLAVILAACTGVQPGAAQPVAQAQVAAAATVAPPRSSAGAQPTLAPTQNPPVTPAQAPAVVGNLTQSAEAGAVTVEITPLNLADAGAETIDFKVVMNTHSVELGVDLTKLAALKAGGAEVAATTWQAPAGGGHHVEGTLRFPARTAEGKLLLNGAPSLSIVIRNLAGVPERGFIWQLGQAGANTGGMPMSGAATRGDMGLTAATPVTGTTPMGQGMGSQGMGAGSAITGTMPMSGDMMGMMADMMKMMQGMMGQGGAGMMGAGSAITGTMPMSGTMPGGMMGQGMQGMMGMMSNMQGMMDMMTNMPPAEHQKMMADMMGQMSGMAQGDQAQMMPQMMGMMSQMLEMMKGMSAEAQGQMMPQMMGMMGQMMQMTLAPALRYGASAGVGGAGSMGGMLGAHMEAIPSAGVPEAATKIGGQPLTFKVENGVKVFELTARPVRWNILDNVAVTAWTFNGTVPGPMIRVTEGDKVRIVLKNELPEATSIHWHGMPIPNEMDGVTAIEPGKSFTYEFTAPPAGSFMYHSHVNSDKQLGLGLYAPFIVDPKTAPAAKADADVSWMLSEWRVGADGQTYAAMPMAGAEPNYFTINGKSYPNIPPIEAKKGQRVRVRLANVGQFTHPMHLHGMNFKIVAYDGVPLPASQQIVRNTVAVNPGELVDIEFVADNVGTWMFHCHVLHHVTNDNVEPGGLVALVNVTDSQAAQASGIQGSVWVANEESDSVSVINAATNQVAVTLTGIPGPHNIQAAADGKSVWAVSGHSALALAIDPTTYTVRGVVPTGRDPAHVILTPNGQTAYVTNSSDDTVTVIDTAAMTVTATIPVGKFPHGMRPSPDGKWVYIANVNSNTVSVIDTASNRKVADVEVGQKPVQVGFAPDGKFVYASLNGENAVGKVDVGTRKLVGKLQVGLGPIQVYVTPDGRYLLVANQGTKDKPSTTVSIVDTATFTVLGTVETGRGAHGVVIEPSSRYAYITDVYGDDVAILDIAARKVVARTPTGAAPNGISFLPLAPAPAASRQIELKLPTTEQNMGHGHGG